jgi:FAD/FMN-containing dehydrogenase
MRTTFGPAYERLEAVKAEYDPEGRFDPGRTVAPAGGAQADGGENVDG